LGGVDRDAGGPDALRRAYLGEMRAGDGEIGRAQRRGKALRRREPGDDAGER
jgi:hypothetical protein